MQPLTAKSIYLLLFLFIFTTIHAQKGKTSKPSSAETWKKEVMNAVDQKYKMAQEMVDMVFSFQSLVSRKQKLLLT